MVTSAMQRAMSNPAGAMDAVMSSINFIGLNDQIDARAASDTAIADSAARFDSESTIRKPVSKTKYWASNAAQEGLSGLGEALATKYSELAEYQPQEVTREAFRAEAKPFREAIRGPLSAMRKMALRYQRAMQTMRDPAASTERKNEAMEETKAYASSKAYEMAIRDSNRTAQLTGTPYTKEQMKAAKDAYYGEYMAPAESLKQAALPPTYYAAQQPIAERVGATWAQYA